jgi:type II secretory pathway pseudopilin PulG
MFVVAIIGLMALLAVPAYFRTQAATAKGNCINNLRVIDVAKEMYALDQNLPNGASVTGNDIELFLKVPYSAIVEPLNGTYYINAIGVEPECSLGEPHVLP